MSDTLGERPRVWTVYVMFASLLVAIIALSSALVAAFVIQESGLSGLGDSRLVGHTVRRLSSSPWFVALSSVLTSLTLAVFALVGALLSPKPWRTRLSLRPLPAPKIWLLAMLGAPLLGQILDVVVTLCGVVPSGSLKVLSDVMRSASGWSLVLLAIALSVGPGLCEELFCRGYVQSRLVKRHGPVIGILVASGLFGIMHLDLLHAPLAGVMGVYLGFLAYRFNTLWIGVIAHAFNNAVATLLSALLPDVSESVGVLLGLGGMSIALFGWILRVLIMAPVTPLDDPR